MSVGRVSAVEFGLSLERRQAASARLQRMVGVRATSRLFTNLLVENGSAREDTAPRFEVHPN
jgi:hypothetical protein